MIDWAFENVWDIRLVTLSYFILCVETAEWSKEFSIPIVFADLDHWILTFDLRSPS